jgi:hypothetical protein
MGSCEEVNGTILEANTTLEHEYGYRFQAAAAIERCECETKKMTIVAHLIPSSAACTRSVNTTNGNP